MWRRMALVGIVVFIGLLGVVLAVSLVAGRRLPAAGPTAAPSGPQGAAPTPTPTATSCPAQAGDIDGMVACLPKGSFTWNPPDRMRIRDRVVVAARIGRGPSPVPTGEFPGGPPKTPGPVRVGAVMAVDLISDHPAALAVEPLDSLHREQRILLDPEMYGEWSWAVTANEVGTWPLRLKIYAHLEGEEVPVLDVTAKTVVRPVAEVMVEHNVGLELEIFLSSNWQWIVTTAVGAAGAVAAVLGLRARRARRVRSPHRRPPPRTR